MSKPIDNRYRKNAVKFLYLYNVLKRKLSIKDLSYLFKHYATYDLDCIANYDKKIIKHIVDLMNCFNVLTEYLDDESLYNLTQLGGQL